MKRNLSDRNLRQDMLDYAFYTVERVEYLLTFVIIALIIANIGLDSSSYQLHSIIVKIKKIHIFVEI